MLSLGPTIHKWSTVLQLAKIDQMPIGPIVDPATGEMTDEFRQWLEELTFGTSDNSIGTILSGQNGIIAGTQPLADVLLTDRGSLVAEQDAQASNITSVAEETAGTGTLTASVSPAFAGSIASGAGARTTSSVTVTALGGVAPYSGSWAKKSGDDIPPDAPTSATTTFSQTITAGDYLSAVYTYTVTDSTPGTPLTATVDVPVTISDISGGLGV